MSGPLVDANRVIADLRELDRRTGGPDGARRVAWDEEWRNAREFARELLGEIGLEPEADAAGNVWAVLEGEAEPALAIGSHLDSVPAGGWLDGALGVMGAIGVARAWAQSGRRPPRSIAVVDWADEEGARFGRSLFGSSAFAGTLEPAEVADLTDGDGRVLADVVADNGVELARATEAGARRERLLAYLELHIEQGPVLESRGELAAAVDGCVGIERHRFTFRGQAAHAGTTPMEARRDAGLAAAATALAVEKIANARGGMGTTGRVDLEPGIPTAVAGEARVFVDLRHRDAEGLAAMLTDVTERARAAGAERECDVEADAVFRIEPIAFDPQLVALAREACAAVTGNDHALTSGALHDAAEVARVLPAAMVFCPSRAGLSHAPAEDTSEAGLEAGIRAFGLLANRVLSD